MKTYQEFIEGLGKPIQVNIEFVIDGKSVTERKVFPARSRKDAYEQAEKYAERKIKEYKNKGVKDVTAEILGSLRKVKVNI